MKKTIVSMAVIALLSLGSITQATTIDWKGVTWDLQNATAFVNVDGSLTLTTLLGGSVNGGLHANRLSSSFENVMDPWIKWSYAGHKADILIEDETYPGATIQAGSNWGYTFAATRYTKPDGSRAEDSYLIFDQDTTPISHVVNLSKRANGAVEASFDSGALATSDYLKDNIGGNWGFNDVYLRMRSGSAGDTMTLVDFQYGSASAVPEPASILAALSILGPAGMLFRRRIT